MIKTLLVAALAFSSLAAATPANACWDYGGEPICDRYYFGGP